MIGCNATVAAIGFALVWCINSKEGEEGAEEMKVDVSVSSCRNLCLWREVAMKVDFA